MTAFSQWRSERTRSIRTTQVPRDRNRWKHPSTRTKQAPRLFGPVGPRGRPFNSVNSISNRAARGCRQCVVFGGQWGSTSIASKNPRARTP